MIALPHCILVISVSFSKARSEILMPAHAGELLDWTPGSDLDLDRYVGCLSLARAHTSDSSGERMAYREECRPPVSRNHCMLWHLAFSNSTWSTLLGDGI